MAIERVRDGEPPSEVISAYGFNRTTIYKWIQAASRPGVGVKALRSRPATGRPRSLTPRQEGQVFRWVNGRDPRQYGLDFGLWTRAVVAELVKQKFDVMLGLTAVGELLAKHGLTPQKPLNAPTNGTRRPSRNGSEKPGRPSPGKPGRKELRSSSAMSRGFAPTRCMARRGAYVARRRWSNARDNGNPSVRRRR